MEEKIMVSKNYLNDLSYKIIGCAIEVHNHLGPGLLESAYHDCLKREFFIRNMEYKSQLFVLIFYMGMELNTDFRLDFLVRD